MRGGLTQRTVVASGLLALVIGAAFAILLSLVAELRAAERRSLQSEGVLVAANRMERLVIDLLYLQQLSVAEIQQKTGWNASLVKVRAFRAHQKMRQQLALVTAQGEK